MPQMDKIVWSCAYAYTSAQVKQMEADLVDLLDFQFNVSSSYRFYYSLCQIINLEPKNQSLAQYII
jgi:hypothetical protein